MVSCVRNISTKNYFKIWNWFSSDNRKCRGCFFGTQCICFSHNSILYAIVVPNAHICRKGSKLEHIW